MADQLSVNGCVESREKFARACYFFVRYIRHRTDRHKLTTKDFIRWHKLSQILERVETNLCAVFRFLWLGNSVKRIWRLAAAKPTSLIQEASSSSPSLGLTASTILRLYSVVTVIDEFIEDYLSIQQVRAPFLSAQAAQLQANSNQTSGGTGITGLNSQTTLKNTAVSILAGQEFSQNGDNNMIQNQNSIMSLSQNNLNQNLNIVQSSQTSSVVVGGGTGTDHNTTDIKNLNDGNQNQNQNLQTNLVNSNLDNNSTVLAVQTLNNDGSINHSAYGNEKTPRASSPRREQQLAVRQAISGGCKSDLSLTSVDIWGIDKSITPTIVDQISAITSLGSTSLRILIVLGSWIRGSSGSGSGSSSSSSYGQRFLFGFRLMSIGQLLIDLYLMTLNLGRTFRISQINAINQYLLNNVFKSGMYYYNSRALVSPQLLLIAMLGSAMGMLKTAF